MPHGERQPPPPHSECQRKSSCASGSRAAEFHKPETTQPTKIGELYCPCHDKFGCQTVDQSTLKESHLHRYKMPLIFVLLICGWFSQWSLAQSPTETDANRCTDEIVKHVGLHFRISHFAYPASGMYPSVENGGLIVAGVCKTWPGNRARVVSAFAYDAGIEYEKQLLVAVFDVQKKRVIAAYQSVIPEDAATEVSRYSLRLDMAPYRLSETTRAFGLRLNAFKERCTYEGGSGEDLTLFVMDGKAIRPVLSETMSHWRYARGDRCGGEDVERVESNAVISVEPSSTNGFADLRLTARPSDKRKPVHALVKYNGDHYDLQPWNKSFSAWWEATVVEDAPAVLLSDAIVARDVEQVRKLVAKGVDLNANENRNETPLHEAASLGKKDIVDFLIDSGANVNGRTRLGDTPLGAAAERGFGDVVELLLAKGADINGAGYLELTPLHKAAVAKQSKIVGLLLSKGANVNAHASGSTPFHYAAMGGDKEIMAMMISKGADLHVRDERGLTPLHRAAYCGSKEAVEFLVAKHVDLEAQDRDLLTPLHWAASGGCTEIVDLLLKNGADANATNWHGETPLQLAIKNKKVEVVKILSAQSVLASPVLHANKKAKIKALFEKLRTRKIAELRALLSAGLSIDAKEFGRTLLHQATSQGDKEMVVQLLERGANPNLKDHNGWTPLHIATDQGRWDVAEELLSKNGAVSAKSDKGLTPLHLAIAKGHDEITKRLIAKGAEINAKDVKWQTPLHFAASTGRPNVLSLLLLNNGDVKARDVEGSTPLHSAVSSRNTETVRLLLESGADVNAINQMGTALHVAAYRIAAFQDNLDMVNFLIAKGADINVKNAAGLTVLQATNGDQKPLIKVLVAHGAK